MTICCAEISIARGVQEMETVVGSPVAGVVERRAVAIRDTMAAGALLCVVASLWFNPQR